MSTNLISPRAHVATRDTLRGSYIRRRSGSYIGVRSYEQQTPRSSGKSERLNRSSPQLSRASSTGQNGLNRAGRRSKSRSGSRIQRAGSSASHAREKSWRDLESSDTEEPIQPIEKSPSQPSTHISFDYPISSFTINVKTDSVIFHEILGSGANGPVYRASLYGFSVAVKKVDLRPIGSESLRQSIHREIGIGLVAKHVNLANYLGHRQTADQQIYIFLELYQQTLRSSIDQYWIDSRGQPMAPGIIHDYLLQIATGLNYLHELSIIHRDLKSENIFLQPTGANKLLKIGDFGEAICLKNIDESIPLEKNIGTIEFMAPEIISYPGTSPRCVPRAYNEKVDIWSYSMIIYELLSGDIPYRKMPISKLELPETIIHGGTPAIFRLGLDNDQYGDFTLLFNACTQLDPQRRPSADKVVRTLTLSTTEI